MRAMADWNVAKTAGVCSVSGRQLEESEEFYCALFDTPEGFERRDFAAEHWTGPPEEAYCFWKSKIPPKEKKKQTFVDDEVLVQFFQRLSDEKDSVKENFRFVLALILMRKRILKYEATIRDGADEVWRMRLVKEQSAHEVRNPRLDDGQITEVSAQLGQILHSDMGDFDALDEMEEGDGPADDGGQPGEGHEPISAGDDDEVEGQIAGE